MINFKELREQQKALRKPKTVSKDVPNQITLQRQAIRAFPNGKKVALYKTNRLNKYISIPYDQFGKFDPDVPGLTEELLNERSNSIIYQLKKVVSDGRMEKIRFKNETTLNVDTFTAKKLLDLYNSLSEKNRYLLSKMAGLDKIHFTKVVDFAHKTFK